MFRKGRKILLNHPASEVTIIAPAVVSAFSFGYLVRDAETGDEGPGASPWKWMVVSTMVSGVICPFNQAIE